MTAPYAAPSVAVQTQDHSLTVGTSAVQAYSQLNGEVRILRVFNVSATATIWASRAGVAAVNAPGSFPIPPMSYEVYLQPGTIPINPLSLIATAGGTPVTIEIG